MDSRLRGNDVVGALEYQLRYEVEISRSRSSFGNVIPACSAVIPAYSAVIPAEAGIYPTHK